MPLCLINFFLSFKRKEKKNKREKVKVEVKRRRYFVAHSSDRKRRDSANTNVRLFLYVTLTRLRTSILHIEIYVIRREKEFSGSLNIQIVIHLRCILLFVSCQNCTNEL